MPTPQEPKRNEFNTGCGCFVAVWTNDAGMMQAHVTHCPLHAAAGPLLDALQALLEVVGWHNEASVIETTSDWLWDSPYTEKNALPAFHKAQATIANATQNSPKTRMK